MSSDTSQEGSFTYQNHKPEVGIGGRPMFMACGIQGGSTEPWCSQQQQQGSYILCRSCLHAKKTGIQIKTILKENCLEYLICINEFDIFSTCMVLVLELLYASKLWSDTKIKYFDYLNHTYACVLLHVEHLVYLITFRFGYNGKNISFESDKSRKLKDIW